MAATNQAALIGKLEAIGDAIRGKTGNTDKLTLDAMPGEIEWISGGGFDTSQITKTISMFEGSTASSIDLSGLDISNVSSMEKMFYNCKNLTSIDFSEVLGFSNIESTFFSASYMFYECNGLTSVELGELAPKITNTSAMFYGCNNLAVIDLSKIKTFQSSMFYRCASLESITLPDGTSTSSDMQNLCYNCKKLKSFSMTGDVDTKTGSWARAAGMFYGCSSLEYLDISGLKTNEAYSLGGMFTDCTNLKTLKTGIGFRNYQYSASSYNSKAALFPVKMIDTKTGDVFEAGERLYGGAHTYEAYSEPDEE